MRRMLPTAAASAVCLSSMLAVAGLPAAADRVPTDALVTFAVGDVAEFHGGLMSFLGKLPVPVDGEFVEGMEMLINADGVNEDGSMAIVMMPDGQDDVEVIFVAPIDDYNALVRGFGGEPAAISEFEVEGESVFAKDLGGGYAALGPRAGVVEAFDGKAGRMGAHSKAVGTTGSKLADSSDLVVMANIPALAPKLKEGLAEQMQQAMGMAQMMGGAEAEQLEAQMKMFEMIADSFLRDAQAGLMGVDFADNGVTFDVAAQFKEGSEIASFFGKSGDAGSMLGRVPDMDYLFAAAADMSPKGLQKIAKNFAQISDELNLSQPGMDINQWMNAGSGFAGVMGKTPGLLAGGLFSNSVTYFHADDGASVAKALRDSYAGMDGQSQQGMTMSSSFDAGGVEVEGRTVDSWSVGFEIDPQNPNAFQMQQVMMMTLGPELKMSGYGAAVDKGYVQTMSRNKVLMAQALKAADDGKGLGQSNAVRAMSARLPERRTAEVYIGIDTMLGYAQQFAAMMGGPGNLDIPENLNPIATGITTSDGGFRAVTVVPMDVIDTIANIAQQMGAGGPAEPTPAGNPRF